MHPLPRGATRGSTILLLASAPGIEVLSRVVHYFQTSRYKCGPMSLGSYQKRGRLPLGARIFLFPRK